MTSEQPVRTEEQRRGRPFPWYCGRCRRKEVRCVPRPYREEVLYDGQRYVVEIPDLPIPRCGHCGEEVFSNAEEDAIHRAFRAQLRLLQAEEILSRRTALGLSRKDLADRLGVAEELVYRWEDDFEIQSRGMDDLLRVLLGFPTSSASGAARGATLGAIPAPSSETGAPVEP